MPRKNGKTQLIKFEDSITKSNAFSMAKFNQGLTLSQTQFFAFAIYKTNNNGESVFQKVDFEKKFGLSKFNTADAIRDVKKIYDLSFSTEDLEQDRFSYKRLVQGIDYENGVFHIKWTEYIMPHIMELKDKFITTDLSITSNFKSAFTWTLYDYLKANYGFWHKVVSKDALLRLFGVEEKKTYRNTAQFKRGVLDIAINEINKYTEFEVYYKDVKEGRAIVAFDLYWSVGEQKSAASTKQIRELEICISSILDKKANYLSIKNRELKLEVIEWFEELYSIQEDVDNGTELTSERADFYLKKVNQIMNYLEKILYKYKNPQRDVIFYNWLDERENDD